jgi:hypothetical protein
MQSCNTATDTQSMGAGCLGVEDELLTVVYCCGITNREEFENESASVFYRPSEMNCERVE